MIWKIEQVAFFGRIAKNCFQKDTTCLFGELKRETWTDRTSDRMNDQMTDQTTDQMTNKTTNQMTDQRTDQMMDQTKFKIRLDESSNLA